VKVPLLIRFTATGFITALGCSAISGCATASPPTGSWAAGGQLLLVPLVNDVPAYTQTPYSEIFIIESHRRKFTQRQIV
jgi:hypothetical protein